jgi:hypothetical protein
MSHLSRNHLLAFVEDPHTPDLPDERRRHLDGCESCRSEATNLRALLADIREQPGGSPSPLFWDHFAARVADAIRGETPGRAVPAPAWRFGRETAAWTALAATVLLASTMVFWRATLHAPAVPASVTTVEDSARGDDLEEDQAWKVVRAAADGLPWEDAQAAGIAAHPGSAEGVVMDLTADERAELARLLETELKRSGV